MQRHLLSHVIFVAALIVPVINAPQTATAQSLAPIIYTVRFPSPETHITEIEAAVPTEKRASIEMLMAVWSPGFYRVEDYSSRVREMTARTKQGVALGVEKINKSRWRINTGGVSEILISYKLFCNEKSVTTNWVASDLAVLNGPATFITLAEKRRRPHEVKLELPSTWKQSMTGLDAAPDRLPHHYRVLDFDTLADSPIMAGNMNVHEFDIDGSRHYLVDAGEKGEWDGLRAAADLEKMTKETRRFWGFLPFKKYVFLNVFRQGGGGLEHLNSTLVTANPSRVNTPAGYRAWVALLSHEYFHAFNVKRLRPIELGPFNYENPPRTKSLWMAEGFTSYYGDLMIARAGVISTQDFLALLSSRIEQLQNSPGRLVQTLEQSSYDVWSNSFSGINPNNTSVSYYVKGQIVGFLLDAKIKSATGGRKSLDDVMRLAYKRYSGERGFTSDQFRITAEEIADLDLKSWFAKTIASTEELDYSEALNWLGLQFVPETWKLEVRKDATQSQKSRLRAWLGSPDSQ